MITRSSNFAKIRYTNGARQRKELWKQNASGTLVSPYRLMTRSTSYMLQRGLTVTSGSRCWTRLQRWIGRASGLKVWHHLTLKESKSSSNRRCSTNQRWPWLQDRGTARQISKSSYLNKCTFGWDWIKNWWSSTDPRSSHMRHPTWRCRLKVSVASAT